MVRPRLIRLSIGSAVKLGLLRGRVDADPTTLYMMTYTGGRCRANCAFCSQARFSKASALMLSRVTWPPFPLKEVLARIEGEDFGEGFRRICIQALNYPGVLSDLLRTVKGIRAVSDVPISVSCQPMDGYSMRILAEAGVDRISIALDAASEALFRKIKGESVGGPYLWRSHVKNLRMAVEIFGRGKVTTHLIVGLGETDRELLELIQKLMDWGVNPSLFAFTPIKGTAMEGARPPSIERYRAIQLCHYLLSRREIRGTDIAYNSEGRLTGIRLESNIGDLAGPEAFMTAGCPGCNRPFYNEGPRGPFYNYPRRLSGMELEEAVKAAEDYMDGSPPGWRIQSNP
ncbi:MAG: radical SAM protein [Candidatus Bathyarchaeia archaeon]|nr:radical SAM protein [Candidatus Bathyarchaeota archaeon]